MAAVFAGDVSPLWTCVFYRVVLDVAHEGFDLRRAQLWTSAFDEWCRAQPELVAYSGQSHAYRAQLLLLHGEWAEASAAASLAEERLRAGDFTAQFVANYQLAELHRLRGEHRQRRTVTSAPPNRGGLEPGLALFATPKAKAA